jgi:hypothetical protein
MRRSAACLSLIAAVVVGIAGCGVSSTSQTAPASTAKVVSLSDDQVKTILDLESQGLIKVKAELNSVYIKPAFWEQMPYDTKDNFGAALAVYCAGKKGSSAIWVEFYDFFSGKKLAKWSQAFGFKVY